MYKVSTKRKILILLILLVLLLCMVVVSLFVGTSGLSFIEVLKTLFGNGTESSTLIVFKIRMPRVVASIIVGGGLAIAGLILQSVLRNPMASPSTLGVSNAAVFGANLAIIVFGGGVFHNSDGETLTINNPYLVSTIAFLFAMLATFLILLLSKLRKFSPSTVVLAGVASGTLFSAGTTLVQYFSLDNAVSNAVFWSFGDLTRASYSECLIMAVVVAFAFIVFYMMRWSLNALSAGDSTAKSLGVRVELVRFVSLLLASLVTAVCISFVGIIGFIGLIAPQLIKRFIGNDLKTLLPASLLTGSVLLLISDTLSRVLVQGVNLPVGAVTSLFGAPIFIYILLRKKEGRV